MEIKLLIFIKDRWTWMGSSRNVDLNCSLWIWPWALGVSQWASCTAQGLWNSDIIDCAYYKSYWFVCVCRGVKVCSLCGKFLFSVQQSTVKISLLDHCSTNIFVSMTGFCRASWKAFCVCLQNMPSVGLEESDCGCKGSCSLFLQFSLSAISCGPVHSRCCLIFAMLCGSFAIACVGNCSLWKYLFWVSMVRITKNCETKGSAWCGEESKGVKDTNIFLCWQWWVLYRPIYRTITKINLSSFNY